MLLGNSVAVVVVGVSVGTGVDVVVAAAMLYYVVVSLVDGACCC